VTARAAPPSPFADYDLVAVGASLGGVQALRLLLSALPAGFPAAVAIVQHRRADHDSTLVNLLGAVAALPVREPCDHDPVVAGNVYLAPAGYHLLVEREGGRFALALSVEAPVSWARPSIDVLFQTAAEAYGRRLAAVLLTGSSEDGAAGIEAVARRGGLTIVEDPSSAHSPVSPAAALARTTVHHVLPLPDIAGVLRAMMRTPQGASP
jgi:two-component system, chemotaxis family, protein-glutamate methylesterase/glutaminase